MSGLLGLYIVIFNVTVIMTADVLQCLLSLGTRVHSSSLISHNSVRWVLLVPRSARGAIEAQRHWVICQGRVASE